MNTLKTYLLFNTSMVDASFTSPTPVLCTSSTVYIIYCVHHLLCTSSTVYIIYCVHHLLCTSSTVYIIYCVHHLLCTSSTLYIIYYVHHLLCTSSTVYIIYYVHHLLCTSSTVYIIYCVHHLLCTSSTVYIIYCVHHLLCTSSTVYIIYCVHHLLCTSSSELTRQMTRLYIQHFVDSCCLVMWPLLFLSQTIAQSQRHDGKRARLEKQMQALQEREERRIKAETWVSLFTCGLCYHAWEHSLLLHLKNYFKSWWWCVLWSVSGPWTVSTMAEQANLEVTFPAEEDV